MAKSIRQIGGKEMKAVFNVKSIKGFIRPLQNVIGKGGTKDTYNYLLINVNDNKIYISGYCDFFAVEYNFDLVSGEDGRVCVDGKKFLNLMKFSTGKCTISEGVNSLDIVMDSSNYKLDIMGCSEFFEQIGDVNFNSSLEGFTFDTNYLKYKINSISHCLSKDTSILAFGNIYFGKNYMVACDGAYGAVVKIKDSDLDGCMLNAYGIQCINNCDSKQINLSVAGAVYGYGDNMRFVCYQENVEYPIESIQGLIDNYKKIEPVLKINVVPETFRDSLARLISVSPDQPIVISIKDSNLELSSYSLGDAGLEDIQVEGEMPESFKIVVDGKILLKMISVFDGDIVWSAESEQDIQYISDNDLLQFFKRMKED
jgi:DNA polymerase III sliding clamp (beta) subunit (PCNA family)